MAVVSKDKETLLRRGARAALEGDCRREEGLRESQTSWPQLSGTSDIVRMSELDRARTYNV